MAPTDTFNNIQKLSLTFEMSYNMMSPCHLKYLYFIHGTIRYIQGCVAIIYGVLLKLFDMIERDNNLCER